MTVSDPTPNPGQEAGWPMDVDAAAERVLRAMRLADALHVGVDEVWRMSKHWDARLLPVSVIGALR